jgi:hypothetical protein
LVGKPEGERPLGRLEDHIIKDLTKIRWKCVEWITVAQDKDQWWAFVNTLMKIWFHTRGCFLTS